LALDLDDEQRNLLNGLIAQVACAKFDAKLWAKSELYNQTLNQIRHENHLTLYEVQP
jgi:hypothetical protein